MQLLNSFAATPINLRRAGDDDHVHEAPAGCECLSKDGVALAFRDNETQAFGASYGSFCAAWEDGKCGADNDETGGHSCGSSKTCSDMWPTFNFNINQPWCCDSWCYVNRTTCTDEKATEHGITVDKSWTELDLWFSYDVCPDSYSSPSKYEFKEPTNYEQFNMSQCPYVVTAPGCECTGQNSVLGAGELKFHGANYGKWCAAWEDGMCDENATSGPSHTCLGVNDTTGEFGNDTLAINSCETHWPEYNFGESQPWCCDAWCYVNPTTCTAEVRALYGIDVAKSWTGTEIYYSYAACADKFSSTQGHMENGGVANWAQFGGAGQDKCPYVKSGASVATPSKPVFIALSVLLSMLATTLY